MNKIDDCLVRLLVICQCGAQCAWTIFSKLYCNEKQTHRQIMLEHMCATVGSTKFSNVEFFFLCICGVLLSYHTSTAVSVCIFVRVSVCVC